MSDKIRPNEKGFSSLLSALPQMGFNKKEPGFFIFEAPYYSNIEIYGDRQSGHVVKSDAEYMVVQAGMKRSRLDQMTQHALYKIDEIKRTKATFKWNGVEFPATGGSIKKIRDKFIPLNQADNGPEITIRDENVTFQWWVYSPQVVFSIIEHLMVRPPQFIGGKFDGGDGDNDQDDDSPIKPGDFKKWTGDKSGSPLAVA